MPVSQLFDIFIALKYVKKAINIVSDFAFKYLNANFVKAGIDSRNFQSIKAFKKAGFTIKFNTNAKISNKCLAIKSKNNLLK